MFEPNHPGWAWSQFFSFLSYKAESAGRKFRKINPDYTSVLRDEKGPGPQRLFKHFETWAEVSGLVPGSSAVYGGE